MDKHRIATYTLVLGLGLLTVATLIAAWAFTPSPAPVEVVQARYTPTSTQPSLPLSVNTATARELTALPGVGDILAGRIVAFREEHGPFKVPEDLLQVKGLGEVTLEKIRPYILFS